jgi:hypothetical protein
MSAFVRATAKELGPPLNSGAYQSLADQSAYLLIDHAGLSFKVEG